MNPLINRIYKPRRLSSDNRQSDSLEKTTLVPKITKKLDPLDESIRNKSLEKIDEISLKKRTILPTLRSIQQTIPLEGTDRTLKGYSTLRRKFRQTARDTQPIKQQSFFPTEIQTNQKIVEPAIEPMATTNRTNQFQISETPRPMQQQQMQVFQYIKAISLNEDLEQQFCYMNRGRMPYDYTIVQYQNRNRAEYITVSIRGITFYVDGISQFYTQDILRRQIRLYNKIKNISFFKNYVLTKTMKIWKNSMLKKRFDMSSKCLEKDLFSLSPIIKDFIKRLGAVQFEMGKINFLQPKISKTMNLKGFQKFLKEQEHRISKAVSFYENSLYEQLNEIVKKAIKKFREEKRITLGEENSDKKGFLLLDSKKSEMKYTQAATMKQYQEKMLRLAKLTDFFRMNSIMKMIKNGLSSIQQGLYTAYSRFYTQHSGTHIPWLKISVSITQNSFSLDPSQEAISKMFSSFANNIIKHIWKSHSKFAKRGIFVEIEQDQYQSDEERNIKYYIDEDSEFADAKLYIEDEVNRAFKKVFQFLAHNSQLVEIYKKSLLSEKLEFYLQNKNLKEFLESYEIEKQIIRQIKDDHQLGILFVDFSQARLQINNKFSEKFRIITTSLPSEVIRRSTAIGIHIKQLYNEFKQNPNTIKQYIDFNKNSKSKKTEIEDIAINIEQLQQLQEMLSQNKIKIGEKAKLQISEAYSLYSALKKRLEEIEREEQKQRVYFEKQLEKMAPILETKAQNLASQIFGNDLVSNPFSQSSKVVLFLMSIESKFNELETEKNSFYQFQKQMGIGYIELDGFNKMEKEFKCLFKLWQFKKKYDQIEQELMKKSYKKIDYNLSQSVMEEFFKQINQGFKDLENIELLQFFKAIVQNYIELLYTCRLLCNEDLLDRHFEEIRQILINEKHPVKLLFTRQGFELNPIELQAKYNIRAKKSEIQQICIKASNQALIIKNIITIESFWKNSKLEFHFSDENKEVLLLAANEDINEKVDDHIIQLHNLSNSKYVEYIRPRVNQQNIIYSYFRNLLDIWMDTQKWWQKLLPIMMSPSSLKHQSNIYYQFVTVDSNLKRFNKQMHELVYIKKISEDAFPQAYYHMLKANRNELEKLRKTLEQYIQQKRINYHRFYFLTDTQLIGLLEEVKDARTMEPYAGLCFEIDGFLFDKELAIGVRNLHQSFKVRSLYFRGQIEDMFKSVEDGLKNALKSYVKTTLPKFKNDPNLVSQWVVETPLQILLVLDRLLWTQFVEHLLSQSLHKELQQMTHHQLQSLHQKLRSNSTAAIKIIFTSLLMQNLYLNQLSISLAQSETSNKDFKWIVQPRFYLVEEEVQIHQMNCMVNYGYEYSRPYTLPVYSSITQKCVFQSFYCFNRKEGLILEGHKGTGKTQLVKEVSRVSGNFFKNFMCNSDMQSAIVLKFLKGICLTGVWACFDSFTNLSYATMSVMFQKFSQYTMLRLSDEKQHQLQQSDNFIHKNTMFFIIRNLPEQHSILQKSKESFSHIYVVTPDQKRICEWMLCAEGFKLWQSLGAKLIGMFTSCRELFSRYDFSLGALRRTINKAIQLKRNQQDKTEQAIIYEAIKRQNYTNILSQDQYSFHDLLKSYFNYEEEFVYDVLLSLMIQHPLLEQSGLKGKYFQLDEALTTAGNAVLIGQRSSKSCLIQAYKEIRQLEMTKIYPLAHEHIWSEATVSIVKTMSQKNLLVFDGQLHKEWVQLLNASLNINYSMVVVNGEKLTFKSKIIFESRSLEHCPPSFISNTKVIFVEGKVDPQLDLTYLLTGISPQLKKQILQISLPYLVKSTHEQVSLFANWLLALIPGNIKQKLLHKVIIWILANIFKDDISFWNKEYPGKFQEIYFSRVSEEFMSLASATEELTYQENKYFHELLVCTKQVAFYQLLISSFQNRKQHILIKGNPGTFKTSIINYSTSNANTIRISSIFTTQNTFEKQMDEKLTVIRKGTTSMWSCQTGYFIVVDDLHMAQQTLTEMIRQSIETNSIRLLETGQQRLISQMCIVAGSTKSISEKIQARFNVFTIQLPSTDSVRTICESMITNFLKYHNFKREVIQAASRCIHALCIYFDDMTHTRNSTWNTVILTKMLKLVMGLKKNVYFQEDDFVDLFTANFKRYAFSKISSQNLFNETKNIFENAFKVTFKGVVIKQKNYWLSRNRQFEKISLSNLIEKYIIKLSDKILFEQAIKYTIKINNEFHLESGHVIFVGLAGSGKKFLTYLSSMLNERKFIDLFTEHDKSFREIMFQLLKKVMFEGEKIVIYTSNLTLFKTHNKYFQEMTNLTNLPYQFWEEHQKAQIEKQLETRENERQNVRHQTYEKLGTNLSMVFAFQKNKHLPDILLQSKLSTCYYCEIKQWSREAIVSVGERLVKRNLQLNASLHHRLAHIIGVQTKHVPSLGTFEKFTKMIEELFQEVNKVLENKYDVFRKVNSKIKNSNDKIKEWQLKIQNLKSQIKVLVIKLDRNIQKQEDQRKLLTENKSANIKQQNFLKQQNLLIQDRTKILDQELKRQKHLLQKIENTLSHLQRDQFSEVKKLFQSHSLLKFALQCVAIILSHDPEHIPKLLSDPNLLYKMKNIRLENTEMSLKQKLRVKIEAHKDFNIDEIQKTNPAAKAVCEWVYHVVGFWNVYQDITHKTAELKMLREKLKLSQEKIKELGVQIHVAQGRTERLQVDNVQSKEKKMNAEKQLNSISSRLKNAEAIIPFLTSQEAQSKKQIEKLKSLLEKLNGNAVLTSFMIMYCSCMQFGLRTEILDKAKNILKEFHIPFDQMFYEVFMRKQYKFFQERVSQNLLALYYCRTLPMVIDPERKAMEDISRLYPNIKHLSAKDNTCNQELQILYKQESTILITQVEHLDFQFIYKLLKSEQRHPRNKMLLYVTIPYKKIKEPILSKTIAINWKSSNYENKNKILRRLIHVNIPGLQKQKEELNKLIVLNQMRVEAIKLDLFEQLKQRELMILDDSDFIFTLEESSRLQDDLKKELVVLNERERQIQLLENKYQDVASNLNKIVETVKQIHPISIDIVLEVLSKEQDNIIRLMRWCLRILPPNKKHLFLFICALKIKRQMHLTKMIHYLFEPVSTGTILHPIKYKRPILCVSMTEQMWKELHILIDFGTKFERVIENIFKLPKQWELWFFNPKMQLPSCLNDEFSMLEVMLIIKVLKPQRLFKYMNSFIEELFNYDFQNAENQMNDEQFLSITSNKYPIYYSFGIHQFNSLFRRTVNNLDVGCEVVSLTLKNEEIQNIIHERQKNGGWIALIDCQIIHDHNTKRLERILKNISDSVIISPTFRLVLVGSTDFSSQYLRSLALPLNLQTISIKSYMRQLSSPDIYNQSKDPINNKLRWMVCLCHSIVLCRQKWPLGYSKDLSIQKLKFNRCIDIIRFIKQNNLQINFQSLSDLLAQIYYQEMQDANDKMLIKGLFNTYIEQSISNSIAIYSYPLPEQNFIESIQQIPYIDTFQIFGFNSNITVAADTIEFQNIGVTLKELQNSHIPQLHELGTIDQMRINELLKKVPHLIEYKQPEHWLHYSRNIECEKYNSIIKIVNNKINECLNLRQKEEVQITEQNRKFYQCIVNNVLPKQFGKLYQSRMSFSKWLDDLSEKTSFFVSWNQMAYKIFRPSYFLNFQTFLQTIRLFQSTKRHQSNQTIRLQFKFLKQFDFKQAIITEGILLYDLIFDQCKYNIEKRLIEDSLPGMRFTKAPLLHVTIAEGTTLSSSVQLNLYAGIKRDRLLARLEIDSEKTALNWIIKGASIISN